MIPIPETGSDMLNCTALPLFIAGVYRKMVIDVRIGHRTERGTRAKFSHRVFLWHGWAGTEHWLPNRHSP